MARLSPFVPFGLVFAFLAWLWPFGPVFGLSDTLYNLTILEIGVICICSAFEPDYRFFLKLTWFTTEFAETVRFHGAG